MAEYAAPCCAPIEVCNEKKEAVIYFHGCSSSPGTFLPYVEEAAEVGYDVYAPLLPGHGTTVKDMLNYGYKEWQKCAIDAVEALIEKYDKIHICGHSLGGALATLTAGKFASTGKIGKVLIMCPGFGIANKQFYEMDYSQVGTQGFPFVKAKLPEELVDSDFLYNSMYLKTVKDLIDNAPACLEETANITSPVTLLYSSADVICDVEAIKDFAGKVPYLKSMHIYAKSGHNILTECEYKDAHARVSLWLKEEL